jgi:hypothetical protein
MAQRFGGAFSPDGAKGPQKPLPGGQAPNLNATRPSRAGGRINMLFLAPTPLLVTAFMSPPLGLLLDLLAFAVLIAAAWMTREGLKAEDAYLARKVARRPAFPRKIAGAVLMAIGLAIAGFSPDASLLNPVIFAGLGVGLHLFSFGLDPMTDKGMEGIDTFQQDRVAKAVDEAEKHLNAMADAILRTGDRALVERANRFGSTARDMFRTVEEDPRDLTGVRKYLGVYLLGARDATAKFADIYARNADTNARAEYEALLDDLELNFAAKTEKMLSDDRTDLDIEIDVLRDRLQRENIVKGDS